MSDLISRSRAIENIWDVFNSYANDSLRFDEYETEAINNAFKVLQKVIEGQQTAYDVEKVVKKLKQDTPYITKNGVEFITVGDAVCTVRKGGVE